MIMLMVMMPYCRNERMKNLPYIAYYVEGIIAIVKEWLRQDCKDDVDMIAQIIQVCVRPEGGSYGLHAHPLPEA